MRPLTKDEFEGWKHSIVSQWFFQQCEELKRNSETGLGRGACFNRHSVESTALQTAEKIGFIKGIEAVFEISPQYYAEEEQSKE